MNARLWFRRFRHRALKNSIHIWIQFIVQQEAKRTRTQVGENITTSRIHLKMSLETRTEFMGVRCDGSIQNGTIARAPDKKLSVREYVDSSGFKIDKLIQRLKYNQICVEFTRTFDTSSRQARQFLRH